MSAGITVAGAQYRVAIMGAGAMGGIVGTALMAAGVETHFVDTSAAVLSAVRRDGLQIRRGEAERTCAVSVTDEPATIGHVDAVLFFVKCYHTAAAAELAQPLVGPSTAIVSLQNGWGNGEVLAARYPGESLVVGITYHSGTVLAPGVINHTNVREAPTFIGPYVGTDTTKAARLAQHMQAGGMPATATAGVLTEVWKKLVHNAATLPPSALTRYTAGALGADPDTHELVNALAREAVDTGRAAGFAIDLDERLAAIATILEGAGSGKASMLQDVEAGRRTEIAVINEAVVKAAAEHRVEVPLNRAMVALIRGYERAASLV